jgi:hypothetical protein
LIEAYLGQSDDDSESSTEASDSDSTSEDSDDDSCTDSASGACMLEEKDDPCVVDRQLDGQNDNTSVSADISHTIDDLTPQ